MKTAIVPGRTSDVASPGCGVKRLLYYEKGDLISLLLYSKIRKVG
jgi:hypothetical protein